MTKDNLVFQPLKALISTSVTSIFVVMTLKLLKTELEAFPPGWLTLNLGLVIFHLKKVLTTAISAARIISLSIR